MPSDYQAYLIRFQRGEGQTHWRVRLENVADSEVVCFTTEWELFRYLLERLSAEPVKELPAPSADNFG
jgi:hypothetical protein